MDFTIFTIYIYMCYI